mgnify:CR=1 FL=1
MTRPKPFLTYFILCAIPLLLLAGLNYWHRIRTVKSNIGSIVQGEYKSGLGDGIVRAHPGGAIVQGERKADLPDRIEQSVHQHRANETERQVRHR